MNSSGAALYAASADRITLGVIGSGGRGALVMGVFQKSPDLRVGAICDVYEPNLENALSAASKAQGGTAPKAYRNYKQLLEDKSIDAVLIASPEHWHHRMVLDALAAGKDIYVEKPLCHTPEEGVELVDAERRSKNIIQVGMQRRSYDLYQEGRKVVASGALGDVHMVRSWWLNTQLGGSKVTKIEGVLDWNQWLGPISPRPLDPDIFRRWRLYSEFAGGIVADQGAHVYDGIHMLMGAGYPLAVTAAAGRPHAASGDTPESVVVTAEYPEDFIGVFTVNYAAMRYRSRNDQMNHLDGLKARMDIGRKNSVSSTRGRGVARPGEALREGLRLGHGPACSELSRMRPQPQAPHCTDVARLSGRPCRAACQPVAEVRPKDEVELGTSESGGLKMDRRDFLSALLAAPNLRFRRRDASGVLETTTEYQPSKSALILCDMWDRHWCRGANERLAPIVEKARPLLNAARRNGMVIIHAPSDTMDFYRDAPQRRAALATPRAGPPVPLNITAPPLPIDDSGGGCDTGDKSFKAWTRQHAGIPIDREDYISDKGEEVYSILKARGIETLFIMGVHTNMCILNRTFAIKQMTRWGVRCVLICDLTDAMYNPADRPFVTHEEGTSLVIEHIERYWCPSVTSADLLAALR